MMPSINQSRMGFAALALAGAFAGMLAASPAKAAVLVFDLTSDHCTGNCLGTGGAPSSAGTITVTETGANMLHFAVSLAAGFTIVNTGFDGSLGFDLNPNQTVTYSALTAGFSPVGGNPVGAQNLTMWDGIGTFEYAVIRDVQGGGAGLPSLSFDLTGTALTLASLQLNNAGQFFGLDVRSSNGNTGLVDASVGTPPGNVPEPTSLMIFGTGLMGAGLLLRRRRRKSV
jgi:PEP-CTERM motif